METNKTVCVLFFFCCNRNRLLISHEKKERKRAPIALYLNFLIIQSLFSLSIFCDIVSFIYRDVNSETESDNQQRQIHQEAHRVFRSRRHISEDLENEHLESRDMDNVREKCQVKLKKNPHICAKSHESALTKCLKLPVVFPACC